MEFAMKSSRKIVSVVDDNIDISKLFQIALSENMEGITVFSFNDPILALGIIDSTIEKPVTIQRLCQRVRDELETYGLANS
jgi:hypothetical protein